MALPLPMPGRRQDRSVSCEHCRLAVSALLRLGPCCLPLPGVSPNPLAALRPLPTCCLGIAVFFFLFLVMPFAHAMVVVKTTRCLVTAAGLLVRHCCFQGLAICLLPGRRRDRSVSCDHFQRADYTARSCDRCRLTVWALLVSGPYRLPFPARRKARSFLFFLFIIFVRPPQTCCFGIAASLGHTVCPCLAAAKTVRRLVTAADLLFRR